MTSDIWSMRVLTERVVAADTLTDLVARLSRWMPVDPREVLISPVAFSVDRIGYGSPWYVDLLEHWEIAASTATSRGGGLWALGTQRGQSILAFLLALTSPRRKFCGLFADRQPPAAL